MALYTGCKNYTVNLCYVAAMSLSIILLNILSVNVLQGVFQALTLVHTDTVSIFAMFVWNSSIGCHENEGAAELSYLKGRGHKTERC